MPRGHRMFAAAWQFMTKHEDRRVKTLRRQVVGGARGRVLEVGVGVGTNWEFLPGDVEYVGIEPDEYLLQRARRAAETRDRDLDLWPLDVQFLVFPDDSFDTAISTLTFCSVADPDAGLAEVYRVLKPGGELRFLEHVKARNPLGAALQTAIRPATTTLGGGCHWDRDTAGAIERAGFEIVKMKRGTVGGLPMIAGRARKPS
jgi:ubiquinone/menaquinone biosynthesis C-methylase UbiE